MTEKMNAPAFKLGERVKLRHSGYPPARIVELRGPLGYRGAQIYRVRVKLKPRSIYIEVREDQMERLPEE